MLLCQLQLDYFDTFDNKLKLDLSLLLICALST